MNEINNPTTKKTFDTINAAVLMKQEFEPLRFAVDKILPHGLLSLREAAKSASRGLPLICALPYLRAASCGTSPPSRAWRCTLPLNR